MIGATDVFASSFRADATGAGADRALAARRTGSGRADPATPDATAADAPEEPIGNVATVTGSASVIRNDKTTPLKVKDDIYLNDVVQTGANSALGITFIDATTFNLKASTKITIDNYVYEDGGKSNAAIFDVAKGTAAFVAASVAKTGDMKITTPTATLGIRGTTGLVEVPEGAAANNPNNVAVKLYPDADGRVGRIEVNDRAGARLGFLTQGASGFTIRARRGRRALRRGAAGDSASGDAARPGLCASASLDAECRPAVRVPAARIPPRQSHLRQSEPSDPAIPARPAAARWLARTGQARTTTAAWSVEPSRPDQAERPARATRSAATAVRTEPPGTAAARPVQSSRSAATTGQRRTARRTAATPGSPNQPGVPPRAGQPSRPGLPAQPGLPPRAGQPPRSDLPPQPGLPPRAGQSQRADLPLQPAAPAARPGLPNRFGVPGPQRVPGLQRAPGVQGAPAVQRPGLPAAPRRPRAAPQRGKPPPKRMLSGSREVIARVLRYRAAASRAASV